MKNRPAPTEIYVEFQSVDISNVTVVGEFGKILRKEADNLYSEVLLSNGWNMISVPLQVDDMSKETLFPTAVSRAWWYNNGYVGEDILSQGRGYWLKYDNPDTTELWGTRFDGTIPVRSGWNMVGPYDYNVDTSLIVYTPANIRLSKFWGYSNGYIAESILKSGKGYWIKISEDGILDLSGALAKTNVKENLAEKNEWGSIQITDNADRTMTLYGTGDASEVSMNLLPPVPPHGIFDARYSSGRLVEEIGENGKEIVINSAIYPIKIKTEGMDLRIFDNVDGENFDVKLNDGEELFISNERINRLLISSDQFRELPTQYTLFQNYPNPFNPSTTIKYALPKDGRVRIDLYNILGERISELVNSDMKAGYHEVVFNADGLASGIYFYRMHSNDFIAVKKIILLK